MIRRGGMRIGIGLPSAVPGAAPGLIADWARRAEEAGFTSLGVVDRMRYHCEEPLAVLAHAAAATDSIGLAAVVVVAPLRPAGSLAAQASALHQVSKGRFTLGVAVGARTEDYDAAGVSPRGRGRLFDSRLEELARLFCDPRLGTGRPRVLVGGGGDHALRRAARWADGYVHGGGPPRTFERAALGTRLAWAEAGRPGRPALWAQAYFALGEAARDGRDYMLDYYAFTGPFARRIADGLLTTPQQVVAYARAYAEAGCEELVLMPAVARLDQVDRLAEALA